jgi:phage protein U
MSGPVGMSLGQFAFEAHGFGYGDVGRRVQTPWSEIKVAQTLDRMQWLGPTSEEVTIKGVLFPAEFGGQASLDGIRAAAMSGTPMMLVSGDAGAGVIHGLFAVQSIDESREYHTTAGTPRKNTYQITLKLVADTASGSEIASIISLFG